MQIFLKANPSLAALVASAVTLTILMASYFVFEPVVAHGISDTFEITQEVTTQISFKTEPNDVTMNQTIPGVDGGSAYGTSTVAIITNNPTGYYMTIQFATTTAMQGENLNSDINNYTPTVGGNPDFNFAVGAGDAEFGYTVNSVTTPGDIDVRFKDNGSNACNGGFSGTLTNRCWYGTADATSQVTIIDRETATPSTGATSTVVFRVGISPNPSPAIETGFYTATATLTALVNLP